jgi:hypothetical protein
MKISKMAAMLFIPFYLLADIHFAGDIHIRPRLDHTFNFGEKSKEDFYTMYRARLRANSDLGSGYYIKLQLSAEAPSEHSGHFGLDNSSSKFFQPYFAFNRVEIGRQASNWGASAGLMYAGSANNPIYNFHYHPGSSADHAYNILSYDRLDGFKFWTQVGPGKFIAMVTIEQENLNFEKKGDAEIEKKDHLSLMASYSLPLGKMELNPLLISTRNQSGITQPITAGFNLYKMAAGFSLSAYYSSAIDDYAAFFFRIKNSNKVGPGKLAAWADYSQVSKANESEPLNTLSGWVKYDYTLHKSEMGSITVSPTWRFANQKQNFSGSDDLQMDFHRNKFELTVTAKF